MEPIRPANKEHNDMPTAKEERNWAIWRDYHTSGDTYVAVARIRETILNKLKG